VAALSFEVQRFVVEAVSVDVVLLELDGRFHGDAPERLGRPTLVVEGEDGAVEVPPVGGPEAEAEPGGSAWRASFAVPAGAVAGATFALSVLRAMLVELPAPHPPPDDGGRTERHVRLAREANAQRHRADAAFEASTVAQALAAEERSARELAQADADQAHAAREQLAQQLATAQEQHAEQHAAAEQQHAEQLAAAEQQHAEQLAAAEQQHAEQLAAAEEQHAQARRALRELRAELESVRRAAERPAHAPTARAVAHDEPTATAPAADPPTASVETSVAPPTEGVRVLGDGHRRRRVEADTAPAEPLPGTAEIGARHIEPGVTGARLPAAAWLARGLALAAIAVVVVALILVLRPG
jgi:hypothetical protein